MPTRNNRTSVIQSMKLFRDVPDSICREMLGSARPRDFKRGDFLFLAGAAASEVFLLTSGRVRIIQANENGEEVMLRIDPPGELIGSLEKNLQGTRNSTAEAIEESKTLLWDAQTFETALNRFPILERNLQQILEQRICELGQRFCEVATAKASSRLACELVRLLKQIGRKRNGRSEVKIPHEWVAEMAAMSQFTVSRFLAKWERQGVVSVRRGTVTIRNYDGLRRLCQPSRQPVI